MEGRGLVLAKEDDADCRLSLTRQSRGTFVYIIIPTEFGEFCVTFLFLSFFLSLGPFLHIVSLEAELLESMSSTSSMSSSESSPPEIIDMLLLVALLLGRSELT